MKKIISLIIVFLLLFANFVFAAYPADLEEQELQQLENQNQLISENEDLASKKDVENQDVKVIYSDEYIADETAVLNESAVDGNVYIMGESVKITDSVIYGNLYVLGKDIDISQANVQGSIFAACENINLDAICSDLYVAAKNVNFAKTVSIARDAKVATQSVKVDGFVGRNFDLYSQNIEVAETTKISSNFNYSSTSEITIPTEAQISNVKFNKETEMTEEKNEDVKEYINKVVSAAVKAAIVALISVLLISKFKNIKREESAKEYLASFGKGLLALIAIPVVSIICFIVPFTIAFGFIFIAIYVVALTIATAFFSAEVSYRIANKQNKTDNKIIIGYAALIGIILSVISFIPAIGGLCSFIVFVTGLGFLVNLIIKKV